MQVLKSHRVLIAFCVLAALAPGQCTYYVSSAAAVSGNGSLSQPFRTIQEGIVAAADGDEVIVFSGQFHEGPIDFLGKAIAVRALGHTVDLFTYLLLPSSPGPFEAMVRMSDSPAGPSVLEGFVISPGSGAMGEGVVVNSLGVAGQGVKIVACNIIEFPGGTIHGNGVSVMPGARVEIDDSSVVEVGRCGIDSRQAEVEVRNTLLAGCGEHGVNSFSDASILLDGVQVVSCAEEGISILSPASRGLVRRCFVSANAGGLAAMETDLLGCLIVDNLAPDVGGCRLTGGLIRNCTVSRNFGARVSGVESIGLTPLTIENTVVAENVGGAELSTSVVASISHSLIGSGTAFPGAGNVVGDPGLKLGGNGDYRLVPGSALIDAGSPLSAGLLVDPIKDVNGNDRVFGRAIDIGALEYVARSPGTFEDLRVALALSDDPSDLECSEDLVFSETGPYSGPLLVRFWSPDGTFDYSVPLLGAQIFNLGAPPSASAGFPSIRLDPLESDIAVLVDGPAGLDGVSTGPLLMPPGGYLFALPYSPGGPGAVFSAIMFQGFALTGTAENGIFAATHGVALSRF